MNNGVKIRAKAAIVVDQVVKKGRSLDRAMDKGNLDKDNIEKSLFMVICYGTIRHYWELQADLNKYISRPIKKKDSVIENLIISGLFQIKYTRIPAHAAVTQTVEASKYLKKQNLSAFVNAVLRKYLRSKESAIKHSDEEAIYNHPQWLLDYFKEDWPDHWQEISKNNNIQAPMWLRVNCKKTETKQYLTAIAESLNKSPKETGYIGDLGCSICLNDPIAVNLLPNFERGFATVQDGAAQIAAQVLLDGRGGKILDACAAPGGKTGHLLEIIDDNSSVTAIDIDPKRTEIINANLERLGLTANIISADILDTTKWWNSELYDLILLDAPCSSTGVIRRHPDIKHLKRKQDIDNLNVLQSRIIKSLWSLLKPGGHLLYVTCSILKKENDLVIKYFLKNNLDASKKNLLLNNNINDVMLKTEFGYQLLPGTRGMDGFYFSLLEKAAL